MKITRISLLAALVAGAMLAYSPALRAQDAKDGKDAPKREGRPGGRGGPGGDMKERLAKMSEDLKLTDEQKKKVEAAMKEQGDKMRALREDSSLSDEQRREKIRPLREEFGKKMKEVLTAEQFEKWEKLREQGRPGGPGGEKKRGGDKK